MIHTYIYAVTNVRYFRRAYIFLSVGIRQAVINEITFST